MTRYASALMIVLAILPLSCGGGGDGEPADTTTETDSPADTGQDTAVDTPADTQPDTEPDTAPDTAPDTEPDSPADTVEEDAYTPSEAAIYFCTGYDSICGFGTTGHFATRDECHHAYDSWTMAQQICAGNALGSPPDCDTATDPPTPCP